MILTGRKIDALKELFNIGIGRGAALLNKMVKSHIRLYVPSLKVVSPVDLKKEIKVLGADQLMAVNMGFKGKISGKMKLIFSTDSALQLAMKLIDNSSKSIEMSTVKPETLCEVGNVVLNSVLGSIGNILEINMDYTVPTYQEGGIDDLMNILVVEAAGLRVGLLANRVGDVTQISADSFEEPPVVIGDFGSEYVQGVTAEALILLDLEAILGDPRMIINEEVV